MRIPEILAVLDILTTYGQHLGETLEQRAVARGFATIARFFGTVAFGTILAHIQRGLMRAIALQRMLLHRAERGHDLPDPAPRAPRRHEPPAEDASDSGQTEGQTPPAALTPELAAAAQAAAAQAAAAEAAARMAAAAEAAARMAAAAQEADRTAGERLVRRIARSEPLTLDNLPSMGEIEAEVHRSPVGRTIAAICRDLGVAPALCEGTFWYRVFDAIRLYHGSLTKFLKDMKRREQRFNKEDWKHPELEWPEETREGVRRVLGFFIGQKPVDPFAPVAAPMAQVAAAATGPP